MFNFKNVTGRFPGMRKDQEFTVYPGNEDTPHLVKIQSDKRIAQVNLETGKTRISDGKGGHQGFHKLTIPGVGNSEVETPAWLTEQLAALGIKLGDNQNDTGAVVVMDANGPAPTRKAVGGGESGPVNIFDL